MGVAKEQQLRDETLAELAVWAKRSRELARVAHSRNARDLVKTLSSLAACLEWGRGEIIEAASRKRQPVEPVEGQMEIEV